MKKLLCAAMLAAALLLAGCKDECHRSRYSCAELEKANYNVFFYFRTGNPHFIGTAQGLENCRTMAKGYSQTNLGGGTGWSHACCMITSSSTCAEKHR